MIEFSVPPNVDLKKPSIWVATWLGSGFLNPAPGTWGSLAALPFGIFIFAQFGLTALLIATILTFAVGLWAAKEFETATGLHDAKMVVIDEVVGLWLALIPVFAVAGIHWVWITIALILFRGFDIAKPWPISYLDKNLKGAWGVMLDDVLAGIAAALIIAGLFYAGFG